jgi:type VI secretion system secreted protein VgrG
MLNRTLQEAVDKMGLPVDAPFDAEMQDRIFMEYLVGSKRPKIQAYINGESSDEHAALLELSKEFASFPVPEGVKGKTAGQSYYSGDGLNKAHLSLEEAKAFLQELRSHKGGQ